MGLPKISSEHTNPTGEIPVGLSSLKRKRSKKEKKESKRVHFEEIQMPTKSDTPLLELPETGSSDPVPMITPEKVSSMGIKNEGMIGGIIPDENVSTINPVGHFIATLQKTPTPTTHPLPEYEGLVLLALTVVTGYGMFCIGRDLTSWMKSYFFSGNKEQDEI